MVFTIFVTTYNCWLSPCPYTEDNLDDTLEEAEGGLVAPSRPSGPPHHRSRRRATTVELVWDEAPPLHALLSTAETHFTSWMRALHYESRHETEKVRLLREKKEAGRTRVEQGEGTPSALATEPDEEGTTVVASTTAGSVLASASLAGRDGESAPLLSRADFSSWLSSSLWSTYAANGISSPLFPAFITSRCYIWEEMPFQKSGTSSFHSQTRSEEQRKHRTEEEDKGGRWIPLWSIAQLQHLCRVFVIPQAPIVSTAAPAYGSPCDPPSFLQFVGRTSVAEGNSAFGCGPLWDARPPLRNEAETNDKEGRRQGKENATGPGARKQARPGFTEGGAYAGSRPPNATYVTASGLILHYFRDITRETVEVSVDVGCNAPHRTPLTPSSTVGKTSPQGEAVRMGEALQEGKGAISGNQRQRSSSSDSSSSSTCTARPQMLKFRDPVARSTQKIATTTTAAGAGASSSSSRSSSSASYASRYPLAYAAVQPTSLVTGREFLKRVQAWSTGARDSAMRLDEPPPPVQDDERQKRAERMACRWEECYALYHALVSSVTEFPVYVPSSLMNDSRGTEPSFLVASVGGGSPSLRPFASRTSASPAHLLRPPPTLPRSRLTSFLSATISCQSSSMGGDGWDAEGGSLGGGGGEEEERTMRHALCHPAESSGAPPFASRRAAAADGEGVSLVEVLPSASFVHSTGGAAMRGLGARPGCLSLGSYAAAASGMSSLRPTPTAGGVEASRPSRSSSARGVEQFRALYFEGSVSPIGPSQSPQWLAARSRSGQNRPSLDVREADGEGRAEIEERRMAAPASPSSCQDATTPFPTCGCSGESRSFSFLAHSVFRVLEALGSGAVGVEEPVNTATELARNNDDFSGSSAVVHRPSQTGSTTSRRRRGLTLEHFYAAEDKTVALRLDQLMQQSGSEGGRSRPLSVVVAAAAAASAMSSSAVEENSGQRSSTRYIGSPPQEVSAIASTSFSRASAAGGLHSGERKRSSGPEDDLLVQESQGEEGAAPVEWRTSAAFCCMTLEETLRATTGFSFGDVFRSALEIEREHRVEEKEEEEEEEERHTGPATVGRKNFGGVDERQSGEAELVSSFSTTRRGGIRLEFRRHWVPFVMRHPMVLYVLYAQLARPLLDLMGDEEMEEGLRTLFTAPPDNDGDVDDDDDEDGVHVQSLSSMTTPRSSRSSRRSSSDFRRTGDGEDVLLVKNDEKGQRHQQKRRCRRRRKKYRKRVLLQSALNEMLRLQQEMAHRSHNNSHDEERDGCDEEADELGETDEKRTGGGGSAVAMSAGSGGSGSTTTTSSQRRRRRGVGEGEKAEEAGDGVDFDPAQAWLSNPQERRLRHRGCHGSYRCPSCQIILQRAMCWLILRYGNSMLWKTAEPFPLSNNSSVVTAATGQACGGGGGAPTPQPPPSTHWRSGDLNNSMHPVSPQEDHKRTTNSNPHSSAFQRLAAVLRSHSAARSPRRRRNPAQREAMEEGRDASRPPRPPQRTTTPPPPPPSHQPTPSPSSSPRPLLLGKESRTVAFTTPLLAPHHFVSVDTTPLSQNPSVTSTSPPLVEPLSSERYGKRGPRRGAEKDIETIAPLPAWGHSTFNPLSSKSFKTSVSFRAPCGAGVDSRGAAALHCRTGRGSTEVQRAAVRRVEEVGGGGAETSGLALDSTARLLLEWLTQRSAQNVRSG